MANKKPVNAQNAPSRREAAPLGKRKPKLGQHFLRDAGAAQRIVEGLGEVSKSTVREVGPGQVVLTALLAARTERLIAIELDRVLEAQLRMKFATRRNVEIIEGHVAPVGVGNLNRCKPGPPLAR